MRRIVIMGRGGAGKTTTAAQLGHILGLPVLELDDYFWSDELTAPPPQEWARVQRALAAAGGWIMDGDLGPDDVLAPRLCRADTVVILDFGLARCAWRAFRRSRERLDFWRWLVLWRRHARPGLLEEVRAHAAQADLYVLTSPSQQAAFVDQART